MNSLTGKFEVEVGKKKYTCHLSMNAFRILCEREKLSFDAMDSFLSDQPLTAVPKVIYYGLMNHVYATRGDIDKLPDFEYFASHILNDAGELEKYSSLITKAFGGEQPAAEEEGNK